MRRGHSRRKSPLTLKWLLLLSRSSWERGLTAHWCFVLVVLWGCILSKATSSSTLTFRTHWVIQLEALFLLAVTAARRAGGLKAHSGYESVCRIGADDGGAVWTLPLSLLRHSTSWEKGVGPVVVLSSRSTANAPAWHGDHSKPDQLVVYVQKCKIGV